MKNRSLSGLGVVLFAVILTGLAGCAHVPESKSKDPKYLYNQACDVGRTNVAVKGTVWLKAQSQEASGQFPAAVNAQSPNILRLEVTNLLGGTEAIITVDDQKYSIQSSKKKVKNETGYGSWGGIPLKWATELFLGRIPCPDQADIAQAAMNITADGDLSVQTQASVRGEAQQFVYHYKTWAGTLWPDTLHWERKGKMTSSVDFKFDDPEDATRSPKKWEAKSTHGEVKVRWKDRDVSH